MSTLVLLSPKKGHDSARIKKDVTPAISQIGKMSIGLYPEFQKKMLEDDDGKPIALPKNRSQTRDDDVKSDASDIQREMQEL